MNKVFTTKYYFIKESCTLEEVNVLLKLGYRLINTYIKLNQFGEGTKDEILYYVLGIDREGFEKLPEVAMAERSPKGWHEEYKE